MHSPQVSSEGSGGPITRAVRVCRSKRRRLHWSGFVRLGGDHHKRFAGSRLGQPLFDRLVGVAAHKRASGNFFFRAAFRTSTRSPRRVEYARPEMSGTRFAADTMPKSVIHPRDRMSNGRRRTRWSPCGQRGPSASHRNGRPDALRECHLACAALPLFTWVMSGI